MVVPSCGVCVWVCWRLVTSINLCFFVKCDWLNYFCYALRWSILHHSLVVFVCRSVCGQLVRRLGVNDINACTLQPSIINMCCIPTVIRCLPNANSTRFALIQYVCRFEFNVCVYMCVWHHYRHTMVKSFKCKCGLQFTIQFVIPPSSPYLPHLTPLFIQQYNKPSNVIEICYTTYVHI